MDDMLSDRISDLPHDVMDIILSGLPLRQAVRTSVLSTKWRHQWKRTGNLVFDEYFYWHFHPYEVVDEMRVSMYVGIILDILLCHCGLIRKFFLYIPDFGYTDASDDFDLLILIVSRFWVQCLTLEFENGNEYQTFPHSVFRCLELKHFSLKIGVGTGDPMKIPTHGFRKLSSLVSLDLHLEIRSGLEVTNIISNCPLLEKLCLDYDQISSMSELSEPLVISALKLKFLSVTYGIIMDIILENTPNISTISLIQTNGFEEDGYKNIVCFFGAIRMVESIDVNGYAFTEWKLEKVPNRLPTLLEKHLSFTVSYLNMYSLVQLRSMFCLIKSSPKLQTLNISVNPLEKKSEDTDKYLQSQLEEAEMLASLRTVKIENLGIEKLEMVFIAIFLCRCPNLENLYLKFHNCIKHCAESKIIRKIKQFSKASTHAKIEFFV